MTLTKKKRAHGHRWQEVGNPGKRSWEKCYVKGCKATRPVPECQQAGVPYDVMLRCCPTCTCTSKKK